MGIERKVPADVARRLGTRRDLAVAAPSEARQAGAIGAWRRETFTLPRDQAREIARTWFDRFPRAAYMTEIESWRELADGKIEFTMRRLPTAD